MNYSVVYRVYSLILLASISIIGKVDIEILYITNFEIYFKTPDEYTYILFIQKSKMKYH